MKLITRHIKPTALAGSDSLFGAFRFALFSICLLAISPGNVMANTLQNISYSGLSGNAVQVTLELAEPASEPMVFTIDNPARIALDLVDTTNTLANKSDNIGVGVVNSYSSAEAKGRTRVVLNLTQMSPYEAKADGNTIVITMGGTQTQTIDTYSSPVVSTTTDDKHIRNVDFRRSSSRMPVYR